MSQPMSKPTDKVGKKASGRGELVDTVVVIIEALVIAVLFRSFLYQPFSIPTASMQSTLMIGDYFIADKFVWGYSKFSFPFLPELDAWWADKTGSHLLNGRLFGRDPDRGDIAVFRNEIAGEDYIKRVIGMPGDTIQMRQGRLWIKEAGKTEFVEVAREKVGEGMDKDSYGDTIPVTLYKETLPNGVVHTIQEIADDYGNGSLPDTSAEYLVPAGHYFMMGDNRDRSQDSRYLSAVGFVPAVDLIGKAEARFFSIKDNLPPWQLWAWPANVRWDRMLQSVYQTYTTTPK